MKKFTGIRTALNETGVNNSSYRVGPLGQDNAVDTRDMAIFDVAHPEVIGRLNAYLGEAGSKPVIDPVSIVRQLQRKLSLVGLQFQIPSGMLLGRARFDNGQVNQYGQKNSWREEYPLTYLGGRYGVLDTTGKIGYDDNISHRRMGQGLKLKIEYLVQSSGMTLVMPQIVPNVSGINVA